MTILFLDIDDVMALWKQYYKIRHKGDTYPMDTKCVKVLNQIIEETNCEIVISSDWKDFCTLQELQQYFIDNNIIKIPIATTPKICYGDCKVEEINQYLRQHHPEKWVAVDDLPLTLKNFVQCTRQNEGIKQSGIKQKIIKYLI